MKEYTKTYGGGTRELVLLSVLSLLFYFPASAKAHAGNLFNQGENLNSSLATSEYRVGPGDVLSITVMDASEFGGKFRVSDSRKIEIAGVPSPFQAEGLSPIELSHAIREALIDARQLRDPKVNVFVEEFHDRTITVLGAVSKPGVYPLQKRTTVLEVLSLAGGALPNAGNTVTIVRGAASVEATGTSVGSVQIIAMNRLVKGEELNTQLCVGQADVFPHPPKTINSSGIGTWTAIFRDDVREFDEWGRLAVLVLPRRGHQQSSRHGAGSPGLRFGLPNWGARHRGQIPSCCSFIEEKQNRDALGR